MTPQERLAKIRAAVVVVLGIASIVLTYIGAAYDMRYALGFGLMSLVLAGGLAFFGDLAHVVGDASRDTEA